MEPDGDPGFDGGSESGDGDGDGANRSEGSTSNVGCNSTARTGGDGEVMVYMGLSVLWWSWW